MKYSLIKEFKPTLLFLGRFILLYFVCNFLYGLYVSSFRPLPDPVTSTVTRQTSWVLETLGWENTTQDCTTSPSTFIRFEGRNILSVYEGCNGLNVMIIFAAFVLAFGPISKPMIWFVPLGIALLHLSNLGRIFLLFFVSLEFPNYLYITHKYVFTGVLFLVVFLLWVGWVRYYAIAARK
ncbi:MAG: exosortase family protein XrtF [Cyclobacteriaceae bacterium]